MVPVKGPTHAQRSTRELVDIMHSIGGISLMGKLPKMEEMPGSGSELYHRNGSPIGKDTEEEEGALTSRGEGGVSCEKLPSIGRLSLL